MKKRIISFFLALVLVFSCLSLNVFASGAATTETEQVNFTEQETELTDAEKYQQYGVGKDGKSNLSAEDFATLAKASGATVKINTDFTELPSELVIKTGSTAAEIISSVTEDTNTYYKWRADPSTPAGKYLRCDLSSANVSDMARDLKTGASNVLGASYVITFDFLYYGNWANADKPNELTGWLFDLRGISGNNLGSTVTSSINFRILERGDKLRLQSAGNDYDTQFSFTPGEWVQLSFWHTPRGIDGIEGTADDNMYHVFANGEYVASCTAVTAPADYTYTASGKNYEYNCATDFVFSHTDFLRNNNTMAFTEDLYAADNFRFYYGDFLECKHDWSYSHTHNLEEGVNVLTAECAQCFKTERATQSMVKSGNLTKDELDTAVGKDNVVINTEFSENTSEKNSNGVYHNYAGTEGLQFVDSATWDLIKLKNNDGDYYLHWTAQSGIASPGAATGEYLRYEEPNSMSDAAAQNNIKSKLTSGDTSFIGRSYAITFDYRWDGKLSVNPGSWLFENLISYTGENFAKVTACNDGQQFRLLQNGKLRINYVGGTYDTDYVFTAGEWVRITLWHTPRGLDGLKETNDHNNEFHVFFDGKHVGSFTAVANADKNYSYNGIEYNPATDFALAQFRFGQTYRGAQNDLFALDNLRFYYGSFAECAHTDINGNSCVENGKCTSCGKTVTAHCDLCEREVKYSGLALDSQVALTNRNVSLGNEINMNVYFELSEAAKADASTLVRLTGADGKRTVEIPLAELELMGDGNAQGRYKATLPLRSIDMAREVKVELIKDGAAFGTAYTTSVEDYLKTLIETDANAAELAAATLNYGAYAQKYFAVKNGDETLDDVLPNGGIADNVIAAEPTFGEDAKITVGTNNVTNFTYASLVLSSTTKIGVYFTASENAVVSVGGKEIAKQYNAEDGEYYITLAGAGPRAFDEAYVITVTDGAFESTITLSVNSVLKLVMDSTDATADIEYQNLIKALYLYSEAAENYKA